MTASSGGGAPTRATLRVLEGVMEGLPEGVEAIAMTSDLQGCDTAQAPVSMRRLLGCVVAEALGRMCEEDGLDPLTLGVVLAGDLYAPPDLKRRGGLGDVDGVWSSFGERFRWVVGVAGNHDQFHGRTSVLGAFSNAERVHPLDGDRVSVDGVTVAGISGVLGRSHKPWRMAPKRWAGLLERLLRRPHPELLVLHEGPEVAGRTGSPVVREALEATRARPLVVFGHSYWPEPVAELGNGVQVINVDSRVVVFKRP